MPQEYEYRISGGSLLRAVKNKTWSLEIYRPKENQWDKYSWEGSQEDWFKGQNVPESSVEELQKSLAELE